MTHWHGRVTTSILLAMPLAETFTIVIIVNPIIPNTTERAEDSNAFQPLAFYY